MTLYVLAGRLRQANGQKRAGERVAATVWASRVAHLGYELAGVGAQEDVGGCAHKCLLLVVGATRLAGGLYLRLSAGLC